MATQPTWRPLFPNGGLPRPAGPPRVVPARREVRPSQVVPALREVNFKRPLPGPTRPPAAKRRIFDPYAATERPSLQSPQNVSGARPPACFRPVRPVIGARTSDIGARPSAIGAKKPATGRPPGSAGRPTTLPAWLGGPAATGLQKQAEARIIDKARPAAAIIEAWLGEDDFEETEKDLSAFDEDLPDEVVEEMYDNVVHQDGLHDEDVPAKGMAAQVGALAAELAETRKQAVRPSRAQEKIERMETVEVPDEIIESVIADLSATRLKVPFEIKQSIFADIPSTITFGPAYSPELDDAVAELKEHMEELLQNLPEPSAGETDDLQASAAPEPENSIASESENRWEKLWKNAEAQADAEAAEAEREAAAVSILLEQSNWEEEEAMPGNMTPTMPPPSQGDTTPAMPAPGSMTPAMPGEMTPAMPPGDMTPAMGEMTPRPGDMTPAMPPSSEAAGAETEQTVVPPTAKSAPPRKIKPSQDAKSAPRQPIKPSQGMQMPLTPPRRPPESKQKLADGSDTSTKAQVPAEANGAAAAEAKEENLAASGATPAPKAAPAPEAKARSKLLRDWDDSDDNADTAGVAGTGESSPGAPDALPSVSDMTKTNQEESGKPAVEAPPAAAEATPPAGDASVEPSPAVPQAGAGKAEARTVPAKPDPGKVGAPSTPPQAKPPGKKTVQDWMNDQSMFAHLPALPKGWIRVMSSSKSIYYVNTETGEQTFVTPKEPLPPHWKIMVSRSSGKTYYFHEISGKCQFDKPAP
mmetsp:Transcript_140661/g.269796  ORF Transcript_140661/g.269796 Transcript_140661/m.269796 type:complete len:755 (-) Transcript_140661:107-2371(-)